MVEAGAPAVEMQEAAEGDKAVVRRGTGHMEVGRRVVGQMMAGRTVTGPTTGGQTTVGLMAKTNPVILSNRVAKEGKAPHKATGHLNNHADRIRHGPKTPKATPMLTALPAKNAETGEDATVAVVETAAKVAAKTQAAVHPLPHRVENK